jgi:hypothetical protein
MLEWSLRVQLEEMLPGQVKFDTGSAVCALLSYPKPFDYRSISCDIPNLQIIEQPAPLTDHPEQSPARMMVLRMDLEMIRQVSDLFTQNGNLHFRRTGIATMSAVSVDYRYHSLSRKRHCNLRTNQYICKP